tara:strand:+ start:131 stop:373 length:243 start_codon:yes stop_codon:yes gene_type:complete
MFNSVYRLRILADGDTAELWDVGKTFSVGKELATKVIPVQELPKEILDRYSVLRIADIGTHHKDIGMKETEHVYQIFTSE